MNTYLIVFTTKEDNSNGYAVVRGCSVGQVRKLLLNQGRYKPLGYQIAAIKEIGNSRGCRSSDLIVEEGITSQGLSAYEIAVKHGYRGSEQEWLDEINSTTLAKEVQQQLAQTLEQFEILKKKLEKVKDTTEESIIEIGNIYEAQQGQNSQIVLLAEGAKLASSAYPPSIYKNTNTVILIHSKFESNLIANKIEIYLGDTLIGSVNNRNEIEASTLLNTNNPITTFNIVATCNGLEFKDSVSVKAYDPIYYGMSKNSLSLTKFPATGSALQTYSTQATESGQRFYLAIPKNQGITLPTFFTMNGAPFVVRHQSFTYNNIDYDVYVSAYVYNEGTILNVEAKR